MRRPRWMPLAASVIATVLFAGLGIWQLERAQDKGDLVAALDRSETAGAVTLPAATDDLEGLRYQRVRLTGRLDGRRQFLLENRIHEGRPGFDVLVPLVRGNGDTILVDRGWVPADERRRPARPVALDRAGEVEVRGLLWLPEAGIELGPAMVPSADGWPRRATRIDYETMGSALGTRLVPAVIRLESSVPWALENRSLRPRFGPMRHVGYAVQWFGLALTVVVITAILLHRGRRRKAI